MSSEQDNLKAWPSDVTTSKFNVFEFYHKILWASQQCEEQRKFHQAKEQEKYFYPTIEDDEMYYQNRRLMKTRSLSDFKPIPNQLYHPNHELTRSTYSVYDIPHYDDDPPPSYIEYRNDDQDENRYKKHYER
ncbi:hypothetical protein MFLAVUS_008463 [Mucor flavus]|uniref:Uncharacterized protein n=1 Tax=Mucor flavus TaxID=439312 RepID=A0ABP9Z756_9FUNG